MSSHAEPETLTVVIPALNEEEAIGGTIARCLEAEEEIRRVGGVESVQWIVVSDGSTDRTVEIAREFDRARVIVFEENQGYGAAIKEGFRQGDGSLVGFLDADGTCDPAYFGVMCQAVIDQRADVVLGSRLGPDSRMPAVRRLGNNVFALLLGFLCGRSISDTASGMRVIRRSSLEYLDPLPDGLHYTPSMSARALLGGLRLVEIPMSYDERIGASKLRVVSDGVRFGWVIIKDVLLYRPERIFLLAFTLCLVVGLALAAGPIEYYATNGQIEQSMIYRFMICGLVGLTGFHLLAGAAFANRMSTFGPRRPGGEFFWPSVLARFFEGRGVWAFVAVFTVVSLAMLRPATGGLTEDVMPWSRFTTGVFGLMLASQAAISGVVMRVLRMWKDQLGGR